MNYIHVNEENNWPSFVDLMSTFVLILIILLVFARVSEVLIRRSQRIKFQMKIREHVVRMQTKPGKHLTCDDPNEARIKFHIYIPTDDLFESGSDRLNNTKSLEKLGSYLANLLKNKENMIKKIEVYGHSDIMPISSAAKSQYHSNLGLSAMRAVSVHDVFTNPDTCGIPSDKILAVGCGEHIPKVFKEFFHSSEYPDFINKVLGIKMDEYAKHKLKYQTAAKQLLSPNRRVEVVLYFNEK